MSSGGKRIGAGRPKSPAPLVLIQFKIRQDCADEIKQAVKEKRDELKNREKKLPCDK